MLQPVAFILTVIVRTLRLLSRSRADLILENLALRQQLASLTRTKRRPALDPEDRIFWIALRQTWRRWAEALIIVRPETVVGWHRRAFRSYWRAISKRPGRPRISKKIRELIRRMVRENPTWRAPRIHSELLKLGFKVGERTVSRYLEWAGPRNGGARDWLAFLNNHREVLTAMDFLTAPTATFRVLYVLFVIHHGRRQILHFNVTDQPTSAWVIQQMRGAFPYETAPAYLLMDRDSKFSKELRQAVSAMGITPKRTSYRSPWQNGVAEPWVGTCRRELLDRVVVLSERHLYRLLTEYTDYYHADRCHLTLAKDAPNQRPIEKRPTAGCKVIALPRVGGLHHRYAWREAA